MTDNADQKLTVSIVADRAAAQQAAQTIAAHRDSIKQLQQTYQDWQRSTAGDHLRTLSDAFEASRVAADKADESINTLREDMDAAADSAEKLGKGQSGGFGGVGVLRTTGRALNQLGLQEVGEPVQKIGDVGIVLKEVQAAATAANIGLEATTVTFVGMEVALSPVVAIAAAATVVMLDLKLALDQIKKSGDDAVAAEKAKFDEEQRQLDIQNSNIQKARTTTPEQNDQNQRDLQQQIDNTTDLLTEKLKQRTDINSQFSNLGNSFNPSERNRLGALGQQTQTEIDGLVGKLKDLNAQYANAGAVLPTLIKNYQDTQQATANLIGSSDDLIAQRKEDQQLTQLSSEAAKARLTQLQSEAQATQEARDQLAKSGNTSKEVTDKIAEYDTALKKNADAQQYLTDTALPLIETREAEAAAIKDADKAAKSFESTLKQISQVSNDISKLEADRAAQVKREQEDDVRNAARAATEKDFAARIADAKREEAEQAERDKGTQAAIDAQNKFNESQSKLDHEFFASELKAYTNYIQSEKDATDRANLERLRTLEDAQTSLRDLAARGDVAGFIDRSNQAKTQLQRQTQDASAAEQQRQQQYEKEIQASRDAHTQQSNDLQTSFAREKAVRDAATAERIAQIEASGREALTKSAQLEQELNNIRDQWRRDDLQRQRDQETESYDERLRIQQEKERELLLDFINFNNDYYQELSFATNGRQSADQIHAAQFGHFSIGIPNVPRNNFPAFLDEGERVLTKQQNLDYSYGMRSGGAVHVNIYNTVGNIATKDDLDEYQEATVGGMQKAYMAAQGRGS